MGVPSMAAGTTTKLLAVGACRWASQQLRQNFEELKFSSTEFNVNIQREVEFNAEKSTR
jgi:hypothetical protein